MSKKANVLIASNSDFNVDFLERAITSRYKLLDRGKIYTVDKSDTDDSILEKEKEELLRKWGMQ